MSVVDLEKTEGVLQTNDTCNIDREFKTLPGYVIVAVGYRERSEPRRDDQQRNDSDRGLEIFHREQKKKYPKDVELRVVCHIPAPQHALESY